MVGLLPAGMPSYVVQPCVLKALKSLEGDSDCLLFYVPQWAMGDCWIGLSQVVVHKLYCMAAGVVPPVITGALPTHAAGRFGCP